MPVLTLVLCSRNDGYGGNSLWRLQTTLNFVAAEAASIGRLHDLEVVLTDWGSATLLRHSLRLSPEAAEITRFVEVPLGLATEHQHDSPFPEVIANNAAIRRASGSFIARIDQDTLVGRDFLARFMELVEGAGSSDRSLRETLFFVGRRSIPFRFARRSPRLASVFSFVQRYRRVLPREGMRHQPWFDAPVGAVVLHRDLWRIYGGYDERLIYWGFMETDLALRVAKHRSLVDLGPTIGRDFYHLGHSPRRSRFPTRRKNPRVNPDAECPNDDSWGLAGFETPLRSTEAADDSRPGNTGRAEEEDSRWDGAAVVGEILWETAMAAFRITRTPFVGDRVS